jgi:tripartite ATP-independent transporter DctM subunit
VIPGILLSCFFVLSILLWTYFRPEIGPRGPKSTWAEKFKSLSGLIETLLLFVLVMGGLFAGFFTPTEAAGIGAFGTIIIALIGRNLTWKGFKNALYDTTRISCMIFIVVAGATVFGHFLAVTQIPADIGIFVSALQLHPMIIMGFIIVIYLLLGCLMDSLAMIMLTIPIFYPVILTLGFDPIWFGVIIVVVAEMGVITPPVGINAYVVAGVARDVPLHVVFKGSLHMLYAMIALALLLIIFPQIALFLPQVLR